MRVRGLTAFYILGTSLQIYVTCVVLVHCEGGVCMMRFVSHQGVIIFFSNVDCYQRTKRVHFGGSVMVQCLPYKKRINR